MKKLFLLLFIPLIGISQPTPKPNTYINDLVNVLTDSQEIELNRKIYQIEKSSSVQLAILLVDKIPGGVSIEEFSNQIGRAWHVGGLGNNGLVYVAAIDEHKQRLEVSKNLEGDIPDIIASDILNDMKPYYKEKNYYQGLSTLIDGINNRINPVIKEQRKITEDAQAKLEAKQREQFSNILQTIFTILLFLGGFFILLYFLFLKKYWKEKRIKKEAEDKKISEDKWGILLSSYRDPATTNLYARPIKEIKKPKSYPDTYSLTTGYIIGYDPYKQDDSSSSSSGSSSSESSSWGNYSSSSDSSSDSGFSGGGSSSDW